jgi:hypothetical protein
VLRVALREFPLVLQSVTEYYQVSR